MKQIYLKYLETASHDELSDWVDTLTHGERIELRQELEKDGCKQLIRSLYFDYDKQVWIEA